MRDTSETRMLQPTIHDTRSIWNHITKGSIQDANVVVSQPKCKLLQAPARVLSNASRAHAKSLHALRPIRTKCQNDAPIRTRELSSRLSSQRRILITHRLVALEHARLTQNHAVVDEFILFHAFLTMGTGMTLV